MAGQKSLTQSLSYVLYSQHQLRGKHALHGTRVVRARADGTNCTHTYLCHATLIEAARL